METPHQVGEADRDRALLKLRWLTVASGIASLVVAALGTSAAARASAPAAAGSTGTGTTAVSGRLSPEQLAALNFALPRPSTVVIWQTPGRPAAGRPSSPVPAPAAAPAPRPAPAPPPPPVATTGTS